MIQKILLLLPISTNIQISLNFNIEPNFIINLKIYKISISLIKIN